MARICLCQFKDCPKSNRCKRYLDLKNANEYSSYAEFKHICNESNNYQWYWETEKEVVVNDATEMENDNE